VVKNQPFLLQLGSAVVDFNHQAVEARLIYDCESFKEVDYVKLKPLEYKCAVNDQRADQVTVEMKIKVLTSQLEDMFFRIKFLLVDPSTKKAIENAFVITEPIKVVSKPEQVKKKAVSKVKAEGQTKKAKKPSNDTLVETLSRIENTCQEQRELLSKLYQQQSSSEDAVITNSKRKLSDVESVKKEEHKPHDFETAFLKFVEAYNKLGQDEKPEKIRRVMRSTNSATTEKITEMLDLFAAEGMENPQKKQRIQHYDSEGNKTCNCEDCPHKKELEKIDLFYNEFLCAPANFEVWLDL